MMYRRRKISVPQWISVSRWWKYREQLLTTETRRSTEAQRFSSIFYFSRHLHYLHLHRFHSQSHRRSNNLIALLPLTCRDPHRQAEAFSV